MVSGGTSIDRKVDFFEDNIIYRCINQDRIHVYESFKQLLYHCEKKANAAIITSCPHNRIIIRTINIVNPT